MICMNYSLTIGFSEPFDPLCMECLSPNSFIVDYPKSSTEQ